MAGETTAARLNPALDCMYAMLYGAVRAMLQVALTGVAASQPAVVMPDLKDPCSLVR